MIKDEGKGCSARSGRQGCKATGSWWCRDTNGTGDMSRAAGQGLRHQQELREHRSELAAKAPRERPGAACREGREEWSSCQDQCRPGWS